MAVVRQRWKERIPVRRLVAVAALAGACGRAATEPVEAADAAAAVAEVAAAITGQEATMAARHQDARHLGFDTYTYPGDSVMLAWRKAPDAPYEWVGYYLTAPCHKGKTWMGKRQTLQQMGWGIAVVYVGQQTWERTPQKTTDAQRAALVRAGRTCHTNLLSASQGRIEAEDAIAKTEAEGFPRGSVIFLDIERMERVPLAMRDYYMAWTDRVLQDGRYRPGYYVHNHNAALVHDDVKTVFAARNVVEAPRFWVASARDFDPSKSAPSDVGHVFAGVWQGIIDVAHEVADIELPIDVNVASWPSPSDWEAIAD